jgi:hypothetical protein
MAAKKKVGRTIPKSPTMSERQRKWFASVEASLERDTGKSLAQWAAIAKRCPETTPGKRARWLREQYGLCVNRAAHILSTAFPNGLNWDEPEALLDQLWKEPAGRKIYDAVVKLVRKEFPDAIIGPRKTFVSLSRKIQFAAIMPAQGGAAELGLPLPLSASLRLSPMKRRPWAEKHTCILLLTSPKEVDAEVKRLLKLAWARG